MKKILSFIAIAGVLGGIAMTTIASAQTTASSSDNNTQQAVIKIEKSVSINPNGHIKIKGVVSGKSGNTITLASWGGNWSIDTTNAKLIKRFGGNATIADIETNDVLEVEGTVSATSLSVTAKTIRDLSIQQRNGTFVGTISQINTGAQTFLLTPAKRNSVKVTVSATTQIITSASKASTFADLKEGDVATVIGTWDRTNSNLTATKIIVRKTMGHKEDNGKNTI